MTRSHRVDADSPIPKRAGVSLAMRTALPLARIFAALLLGMTLLVLSALLHSAAAAGLGGVWPPLWVIWTAAIAVSLLIVIAAPTGLDAWRRMSVVNGVVSLGLMGVALTADLADRDLLLEFPAPFGGSLGVAIALGKIAFAGLVLALLFFAAWHFLPRHKAGPGRHA